MLNISKLFPKVDANTQVSITIILLISTGIFSYLSLFGLAGSVGGTIASVSILLLGRGAFLIPVVFFIVAGMLFKTQKDGEPTESLNSRLVWGMGFISLSLSGYFSFFEGVNELDQLSQSVIGGGVVGYQW